MFGERYGIAKGKFHGSVKQSLAMRIRIRSGLCPLWWEHDQLGRRQHWYSQACSAEQVANVGPLFVPELLLF